MTTRQPQRRRAPPSNGRRPRPIRTVFVAAICSLGAVHELHQLGGETGLAGVGRISEAGGPGEPPRQTVIGGAKSWKELKARYRLDAGTRSWRPSGPSGGRCTSEPERSLTAYVFFALNDRLVTDLGLELLYPLFGARPPSFVSAMCWRSSSAPTALTRG